MSNLDTILNMYRTGIKGTIVHTLANTPSMTGDALIEVIYRGAREPEHAYVGVKSIISNLRKELRQFGWTIRNERRTLYKLNKASNAAPLLTMTIGPVTQEILRQLELNSESGVFASDIALALSKHRPAHCATVLSMINLNIPRWKQFGWNVQKIKIGYILEELSDVEVVGKAAGTRSSRNVGGAELASISMPR